MTGRLPKKAKNSRKEFASIAKMYIFATFWGKPQSPTPPAGGSLRGHRPQKGKRVKEKNNIHHLHIELTPEQYATLCAKAKKSGLTKRALIARLLEGQEIRECPSEEIRQLRTEIHQIGNNINQIVRSVNAGIANADDAGRGLYMLNRVYELLYRIGR